jgi:type I restriction-modification system DNA methylase subunit
MANERITEDIVRQHFKNDAVFSSVKFEEQKSSNKRILELLKGKSKTGGSGDGKPEFIISFPTNSNYIIVVECKAKPQNHESINRDNAKDFAVDGVLHYAKALKEGFNVVAIAVSGESLTELEVSQFYWKRGFESYSELPDKKLLAIDDYMQVFEDQFFISDFYTRDIASKARLLNVEYQAYTIPEYKRCTMVSAMLLALIDVKFKDEYESAPTIKDLGRKMLSAINHVFEAENDIVRSKTVILREFESILNEPLFTQENIKHKNHKQADSTLQVAKDFITYLKKNVYPLVEHSNIGYDVLGRFYVEFIRYAGSEQKSGLVLTPAHITELFCDLADIRLSDVVYDPCCGTGGFLVAAMQRLFKMAGNDKAKREHIRKEQICGCELRSDMFAYACSSMRFRGDGKSNLYNGSCFNYADSIADNHKPSVAMLNPPYDVGNARQMEFIEHALSVINPQAEGRVIAIVQMSCAIKNEKELKNVKKRILSRHHLKAVLSMPDDLFYPVGVVTCIMVFEANKPNAGKKTWFGYFKDDGFEKRKNLGRIDARNKYNSIKDRWLDVYKNNEEVPGLSVRKEVSADDEWCAEAYMETDYSKLNQIDFEKKVKEYIAYKFLNEQWLQ